MKVVLCLFLLLCAGYVKAESNAMSGGGETAELFRTSALTREEACNELKSGAIKANKRAVGECTCRVDDDWHFCTLPVKPGEAQANTSNKKNITENDSVGTVTYTFTISASDQDEPCKQAQSRVNEEGLVPSGCNCQKRGKTIICRLQVVGSKPPESLMFKMRSGLKEMLKCKPEVEDCTPPKDKATNGGPGVRG